MARSSKKGPWVDPNLIKKIQRLKKLGKKEPIKTWARSSQVAPDFVGYTFQVHNGRNFVDIFITESMVGHRLGEFAPTRTFRGHGKVVKRILSKT